MEEREIIRVTVKTEEDGEEYINVDVKNHYDGIRHWTPTFITMAKCVAKVFLPKTAEEQAMSVNAGLLLRASAMSMPSDASVIKTMGIEERHPREVSVPARVWETNEAEEVLRIWALPLDLIEEDGDPLEKAFILAGETESVDTEKFGDLLAQVATRFALFKSNGSEPDRLRIMARIQNDFNKRFDWGMTIQ